MIILNENEKKILNNYFLLEKNNSKKDYLVWKNQYLETHHNDHCINLIWNQQEELSLLMYLAQSPKMKFSNTKIKSLVSLKLDFEYQNQFGQDIYFYLAQNSNFNYFYSLIYCNELSNDTNDSIIHFNKTADSWISDLNVSKLKKNIDIFFLNQNIQNNITSHNSSNILYYFKVFQYFVEHKLDVDLTQEQNLQILKKITILKEKLLSHLTQKKDIHNHYEKFYLYLIKSISPEYILSINPHIQYLDLKYNMKNTQPNSKKIKI